MRNITDKVNLLKRYLSKDLDALQEKELAQLFLEHPELKTVIESLEDETNLQRELDRYNDLHSLESKAREHDVLQTVLSRINEEQAVPSQQKGKRRRLLVYASVAAAAVLVFFTTSIWKPLLFKPQSTEQLLSNFVPGSDRATLTLSNGRHLELTSSQSGIVVDDYISYEDGTALFEDGMLPEETILTLSTPRGGQYQVTLPDGTKVMLNAASTLRYPYRFSSESREVELEGEAYFEVAHQKEKPFIVKTASENVEVLGTHFNVTSYTDDGHSSVALVEGKVKVSLDDGSAKILTPGQQSVVSNGKMSIQPFNVEEALAWKNGEFMFNNESIISVAKKLSRWYDVEIEVDPKLSELGVWGSLSRKDDFNTVLHLIKMTDDRIRIQVKGRSVKLIR